jgi:hypothetical protein
MMRARLALYQLGDDCGRESKGRQLITGDPCEPTIVELENALNYSERTNDQGTRSARFQVDEDEPNRGRASG